VQRAQARAPAQHRLTRFNRLDERLHDRFYARTFPEADGVRGRISITP
jgi:hypothetical protein